MATRWLLAAAFVMSRPTVLPAPAAMPAAVRPTMIDANLFEAASDIGTLDLGSQTRSATLELAPSEAPFPFSVALPSWNCQAPAGTGLQFEMRFKVRPAGNWSSWKLVGDWGEVPTSEPSALTDTGFAAAAGDLGGVSVNIDTVKIPAGATGFQWRIKLFRSAEASAIPRLSRLTLCVSGEASSPEAARYCRSHPAPDSQWTGIIPVPYRSQHTDDPRMKSSLCSPTTTAMALAYAGVDVPVLERFAQRVYDPKHDLFGVWPRAVAAASERGLPGYVSRFRNFQQLRAELEKGHLVGASVSFRAQALKRPPPYSALEGHLLLIRGILSSGEIIVNDPATREVGNGFAWLPEDFAEAWFGHGGVGYVFEPQRSDGLGNWGRK